MLNSQPNDLRHEAGSTLLEVLITIVILAFGLLGLAGLQSKIQLAEVESYQRAEAVLLLNDMAERMQNYDPNVTYASTTASLGGSDPGACVGAGFEFDKCEWAKALFGSAEASSSNAKIGAMIGARGCVTKIQNPDCTTHKPGIYLVTVTWKGMHPTATPSNFCPGDTADNILRSVSARVSLGLPECI